MEQTKPSPTPAELVGYQRLPSTGDAAARLAKRMDDRDERVKEGRTTFDVDSAIRYSQRELARCRERDAIHATRPEGCCCLGLGYLQSMDGQPARGCSCPEGVAYRAKQGTIREQTRALRIQNRWEGSGVPPRFQDFRLNNSPALTPELDSDGFGMGKWTANDCWFLWGAYGRGKTGLAVGWLWERLQLGDSVLFVTVPDLLGQLRASYNSSGVDEQELIAHYTGVHCLVIDDLGAEQVRNQEWVADRLYQIIGKRHGDIAPTVFTSNLSMAEVAEKIGERITWRIVEMCGPEHIVEIKGPNLRELQHG